MSPSDDQILIVAGEPSGDLHAGRLTEALLAEISDLGVFGIGGNEMRRVGARIICDCGPLAAVGIRDFPRLIPILSRLKHELIEEIRVHRPRAVILVDYPGFNISFAKTLKNLPNPPPLIYFIPPQVWAWGGGRARTIARLFDLILTIYPFEPLYFNCYGGRADFVGNPVAYGIRNCPSREEVRISLGIPQDTQVISFLPGSRIKEIERHLPHMEDAIRVLRERISGVHFLISEAEGLPKGSVRNVLSSETDTVRVIRGNQYEMIRAADVAAVSSGTATLETALLGTPLIVMYIIEMITYLVGRYFLMQVDYFSLVNLLAGWEVVPEVIQRKVRGGRIAELLFRLLGDSMARDKQIRTFEEIRRQLDGPDPYVKAASRIRRFLENGP